VTKVVRFLPALGAVFFAVVGLSACGGIPGDAVVQVDGKPITKTTFNHWMGVAATSTAVAGGAKTVAPEPPNYTACIAHLQATQTTKPAPTREQLKKQCETQYKSLLSEVLGFLISSNWVIGEANSLGVKLSDAEVKKQFETIKSQQFPKAEEFEKFLATSGQSVSDLLLRVKLNLLSSKIQQKIIKAKATPTHAQIEKYYEANKSRFGAPEKRNVEIILTKDEAAAQKAKKEVQSGKSFASVAKAVSIDPVSKASGGQLKEVVKGQEEKSLDEAVFSAKPNVLSGPVKTPFGYYIFAVTGVTAGSQQALSAVESTIKQQLTASQQQQALSKFVKEFKNKWKAKTDCRSAFVVPDCKQYKAPQKATATP
jgi:foldase protein PrsA